MSRTAAKIARDWVIECCELVLDDICLDLYYSNQTNNKNQLRSKVLYLELIFQKHLNFSKELTSLRHLRKKLYKNFWLNYELKEQEYSPEIFLTFASQAEVPFNFFTGLHQMVGIGVKFYPF